VTADPSSVDKTLARRKSVIDLVSGEIGDLRGRVGKEEQQKLDQHLDALRKVELGLQGPGGCDAPPASTTVMRSAGQAASASDASVPGRTSRLLCATMATSTSGGNVSNCPGLVIERR